jgi:hypothetical protein
MIWVGGCLKPKKRLGRGEGANFDDTGSAMEAEKRRQPVSWKKNNGPGQEIHFILCKRTAFKRFFLKHSSPWFLSNFFLAEWKFASKAFAVWGPTASLTLPAGSTQMQSKQWMNAVWQNLIKKIGRREIGKFFIQFLETKIKRAEWLRSNM